MKSTNTTFPTIYPKLSKISSDPLFVYLFASVCSIFIRPIKEDRHHLQSAFKTKFCLDAVAQRWLLNHGLFCFLSIGNGFIRRSINFASWRFFRKYLAFVVFPGLGVSQSARFSIRNTCNRVNLAFCLVTKAPKPSFPYHLC